MYEIVRSHERYHFETDWLSTYWHFSFDHYYDRGNVGFGPLRVFNDDIIQPGKGFGMHGHQEMEIVTYVLEGALEHRDSTGGLGVIRAGEVQKMSAGTGIRHSEFNASQQEPVHLLQIWILPNQSGAKPGYQQKQFSAEQRRGTLLPVVSGRGHSEALYIYQDTAFYVATIRPEDNVVFETTPERRGYLFVISGAIKTDQNGLESGDVAKIRQESGVPLRAGRESEILLIDLP